jgi:hypothetical protein
MRALLLVLGAVLLLLVLAQIALPRIAASKISSRVGRYGTVQSVHVSAWPAVKLLWGDVDSVQVRAGRLALSTAQAAKLLWEANGVSRMELSASAVKIGPLWVEDAVLHKRGSLMSAHAQTSEGDVRAALPEGLEVRLVGSRQGQVEVQASGGLFGVDASVDALAGASEGKLVAHPLGLLLEGFQLTLFADPHVFVEGVGASVASRQPLVYGLSMSASLR